jgi:hypothetical protein
MVNFEVHTPLARLHRKDLLWHRPAGLVPGSSYVVAWAEKNISFLVTIRYPTRQRAAKK